MKTPFLIALGAGVLSLLIAFVPVLQHMFGAQPVAAGAPPASAAPWQVERPGPGQSRVFGLSLPGSTLAQARQRWGDSLKLALMAERDGPVALEGYLENFEAGGVSGRLLLAFGTPAEALAGWRERLPGTPIASGGRQHALTRAAMDELAASPLVGLSFIPAAQLDAQVLSARFGAPGERIASGDRLEHWLYPALGLAVVLDAKGRDVLQYVAPADFEHRLAAPLRRAKPAN
jgi:hypothetical protein